MVTCYIVKEPSNNLIQVGILRKDKSVYTWKGTRYDELLFYIAAQFGFQLVLFNESDIDFVSNTVHGTILRNGEPEEIACPIPKIVDNKLPGFSEAFFRKLDNHTYRTKYRTHTGKLKAFEKVQEAGRFAEYLIPSTLVESFDDIIKAVETTNSKRIVVKHANIDRGEGVFGVEKVGKGYTLTQGQQKFEFTKKQLEEYYNQHIGKFVTIWQPHIVSKTKHGSPFDIRISCRRGDGGKFAFKHYARIGSSKGIMSNWSKGGYTLSIDGFIQSNFPEEDQEEISNHLDKLGREFPEFYAGLFDVDIFDVGLDVGIEKTKDGYKFWFFEINVDLGGGNIWGIEEQVIHMQYFRHLAEKLGIVGTTKRKQIEPIWPIEVRYKPTIHDFYYVSKGQHKIGGEDENSGLTHNNGNTRLRKFSTIEASDHGALDIIAKIGTKVVAIDGGTVIEVRKDCPKDEQRIDSGGNYATIKHNTTFNGEDVYTSYQHLSSVAVKVGQKVARGKVIGLSGMSGDAQIPHLHFQVRIRQNHWTYAVDPLEFLPKMDFDKMHLEKKLSKRDGFPTSAIELYNDVLENGWWFTMRVKAKSKLVVPSEGIEIPAGTVLEVVRRNNNKCTVLYEGKNISVPPRGLYFTW
ncbi:MAG: YheC/YheD family protein [Firmicutes bacterium]|nr:YheC/YheD family protein [Bacillota bacterium]